MRIRLVQIGKSRGLCIPKALIAKAGFRDEVDVTLRDGALVITSAEHPRAGWEAAVTLLLERREDYVFEEPAATRFDEEQWEW